MLLSHQVRHSAFEVDHDKAHDKRPVYRNAAGRFLYFWGPMQRWMVGSNYTSYVNVRVASLTATEAGCPNDPSSSTKFGAVAKTSSVFDADGHLSTGGWAAAPVTITCADRLFRIRTAAVKRRKGIKAFPLISNSMCQPTTGKWLQQFPAVRTRTAARKDSLLSPHAQRW